MAKPNPLTQGLKQHQARQAEPISTPEIAPAAQAAAAQSAAKRVPPSRVGRVLIGGHFAEQVQTELKVLAAVERTSVQALLAEGINAVFARRHKPQIATLTPASEAREA
jgi:hypothetical protein